MQNHIKKQTDGVVSSTKRDSKVSDEEDNDDDIEDETLLNM